MRVACSVDDEVLEHVLVSDNVNSDDGVVLAVNEGVDQVVVVAGEVEDHSAVVDTVEDTTGEGVGRARVEEQQLSALELTVLSRVVRGHIAGSGSVSSGS